jgi:hypothetical protein
MALLEICARHDIFFADEKLISSCSKLNDFSEVGRYPNDLMQSYGTEYPNSVHFLDEFTYKMRLRFQPRQVGENIADGIHAIFINTSHPLSNNARAISSQLMSAMYLDNPYAERIIQQFPGH